MTTLIRVMDASGKETRRCDGRCDKAKLGNPSRCVCSGHLRGIGLTAGYPDSIDPDYLNWVRAQIRLNPGESIQMTMTA